MDINRIFRKIASENGVSVNEVRNEIQSAIDEGMKDPDPKVREYWSKIPHKGKRPTPEEVITFIVLKQENKELQ